MNNNGKKIEIYSTESCHFCQMAKKFFTDNNIPFTDYNVGINTAKRTEMVEKSGQLGVPVIVIDDKDIVIGFDKSKLSSLLDVSK
ncbi:MAG: NrdH-redoxin [Candidatus Zambryskibacteria bacterium]|nr:NrdH-redoxin [Candidatus Zambryskibacteria bacterium]